MMTPKIDGTKLRKYFSDAKAAHAALMASWEETRAARRELADAETALTRAKAADHATSSRKPASTVPDRAPLALETAAVSAARAKLARIEAEREKLDDEWNHASRLKRSVADYARANGALPADLEEECR